jgi:outer membrane receptor protein involved in Fe transport
MFGKVKSRVMFVALLFAISVALADVAAAQVSTATLVGRVTDAAQSPVPGALIQVRNVNTNEIRTAQTAANGEYTVSNLPPGLYNVNISRAGFKQSLKANLELKTEQTARLDTQLEVGSVSETVEVTAQAPLLNSETSSRGDVIATYEIEQMPLNGRDFNDLAFNVPGVQPAEEDGKGSPFVVNGARADATNVTIDGVNNQNPRDAGAQARPPLDSLQEFKLQTSGYSAEYGRLAGGVVNMSLKTGGNQLHGSIFEFVRNDLFDARNFFDAGKSKLRRNQFGATGSGPVLIPRIYDGRDRTFFVVSWESFRQVQGVNRLGVVPTLLERQGNFSQSSDVKGAPILLKDPLARGSCTATNRRACFPGNVIPDGPDGRINSIARQLLNSYPLPNRVGPHNYLVNAVNAVNWDSFVFKVDHKLTAKDNLSARVLTRRQTSTDPFSGSELGTFGAVTKNNQGLFAISETRIFSPTLVNEFRVGLTRTTNVETSNDAGTNFAAQLGIPGTTGDPSLTGFPKFSVTGYSPLGDSVTNPIRYTVNNYHLNNVMTWIKGKHSLKFGGDVLRAQYFQPTNSNFNGTFTFNGKYSGHPFADFLLGSPSSTSRRIGAVTNHIFSTAYAAFIQDDYKVLQNLTFNLGLRYEVQARPYEQDGQFTNYVPAIGKVILADTKATPNLSSVLAAAGLTGLVGTANEHGLPPALVKTNYGDVAPRLGLAWRPFGDNHTVVRGGYGIFYTGSRLSAIRTDFSGGFPFSIAQTFTGPANNPALVTLSNPFPAAIAKTSGVTSTKGFEVNAPSPYLQSWNLTFERELIKGVAVEVGYTGSKGTHLGRKYDVNQALRQPDLVLPNGDFPRPLGGFGEIEYYSFGFNSSYNAGTVTLRKRFENGLFFRVNYTYGKSIDSNSGLNYAGAGGYQGAQNTLDTVADRGRSDFDIRHVFTTNFVYQLPFNRGPLLRGWQLAGSGAIYSGQPFTPQLSGPSQSQGEATRPDRTADGRLADPSPNMWFDLAAFQIVPDSAFRFGSSGRNILDGPGSVVVNLSLSKQFQLGERGKLQFRWEAFNAVNHTNFYLPNVNIDEPTAGVITRAKDARVMQFGVRYQF